MSTSTLHLRTACGGRHIYAPSNVLKLKKTSIEANAPIVEFKVGDLVQWYDSEADKNHLSVNKLKPRWSAPTQICAKFLNSFSLCSLDGIPLKNLQFVHSRRLRHFIPLRGSTLDQKHPREEEQIPSAQDLELADAEEKMAESLYQTGASAGDTL
ncbi:hypothetical protein R3P38DRAFT_420207 [Favolaschia claudopus]|uniref:Uncharacterized protein n=1 Tax=Favolaschia claudopus TaxID=2862362 RepID=A0AAW0CKJ5_9AGAR